MKKTILRLTGIISLFISVSACDNGYNDVPVIDSPPSLSLGAITSGLVEGQDFKIEITIGDGRMKAPSVRYQPLRMPLPEQGKLYPPDLRIFQEIFKR